MTSYYPESSPLHRLWRALTADFSLGTWFSVHVRMYWAALILMPLVFLRRVPATGLEALAEALLCFVGLFVIIWTHEMGHITAARRYHIRTDKITLGPLGGLAHLNAPASHPQQELWIALAGPAVHLAWLLPLWCIEWLMPETAYYETWYGFLVWYLVVTNQVLLVFNLLPIFPLDGGRALRALLAMRVHANRATLWAANIGIGGGAIIMLLSMTRANVESSIGFVIGLTCIFACINEKRLARHALIYQSHRADPWATDPDAWKRGIKPDHGSITSRQPGWLQQRRQARAARIAAAKRQADAQLSAQVDQILERVSQVGITGLTQAEKDVLQRASKQRRGAS